MELFVNVVIDGKSLKLFLLKGRGFWIHLWNVRVKYNLKVKFAFYAKVQGKVNIYAKMKKKKILQERRGVL